MFTTKPLIFGGMLLVAACCKQHSLASLQVETLPTVRAAIDKLGQPHAVREWRPSDSETFDATERTKLSQIAKVQKVVVYTWRWSSIGRNGRPCQQVFVAADANGRVLDVETIVSAWH
jgi:hypothetical protein